MRNIVFCAAFFLFLAGLMLGYEISKWANMNDYNPAFMNYIFSISLMAVSVSMFLKIGN